MLTRRQFVRQSAILGLAGSGIPNLCAEPKQAEKQTALTFGFTLYGMRKLPLNEAIKVSGEIGYDSVELACMADWPGAPEALSKAARTELSKRLADQHVAVSSLMENLSPLVDEKSHTANLERLKRACELGHDVAPQATPIIETVLGGKPAEWDQVRNKMAERLQDWGKVAEAGRTVFALKPHVGGALHTPEGAKWLKEQLKSPWLKLAYDYSHYQLRSLGLKESLETILPETAFIHVKDSQGDAAKFQFLLPGDGRIDYREYFRLLKSHGYAGPLVVEVSGQLHTRPDYDPVAAAKKSYANLAPILMEAGIWKPK